MKLLWHTRYLLGLATVWEKPFLGIYMPPWTSINLFSNMTLPHRPILPTPTTMPLPTAVSILLPHLGNLDNSYHYNTLKLCFWLSCSLKDFSSGAITAVYHSPSSPVSAPRIAPCTQQNGSAYCWTNPSACCREIMMMPSRSLPGRQWAGSQPTQVTATAVTIADLLKD